MMMMMLDTQVRVYCLRLLMIRLLLQLQKLFIRIPLTRIVACAVFSRKCFQISYIC